MKSSLLGIFLSIFTFTTISFIAGDNKNTDFIYQSNQPIDTDSVIISRLDSIEQFKNTEIDKYVKKIQKSFEVIKKTEKEQKELLLFIDSLGSVEPSADTLSVDTVQVKKKSWLKKQIEKIKNKPALSGIL